MIVLWVNKGFIDNKLADEITKIIVSPSTCQIPPTLNLISPNMIEPPKIISSSQFNVIGPPPLPFGYGYPPPPLPQVPLGLGPNSSLPITMNNMTMSMIQPFPPSHIPMLHQQPPLSSNQLPMLDMTKITVGSMADIVKSAIKTGHTRYVALDISALNNMQPNHVEPGRLDIRVNEFYKKYESIK